MYILVTGGTGFIGKKVVLQLAKRNIKIIVADINLGNNKKNLIKNYLKLGFDKENLFFEKLDLTNYKSINQLFKRYTFDAIIHLAYGIGSICEQNPVLASQINIVGTTCIFEKIIEYKIPRMIFTSSETVYGSNQSFYGNRDVSENDYCGMNQHFFTYGAMKSLNEFMAEKYIKKYGCSIAYTRPSVVYGYGRQNTAINWAEDFAAKPAMNKEANLPFSKNNFDNWIYVDDCAEQLVRLTLKNKLKYSAYNTGSQTVSGIELEKTVKKMIPNATINFDESIKRTPLIDSQDDTRIRNEINFAPRSFYDGVKELINDTRIANKLQPIKD